MKLLKDLAREVETYVGMWTNRLIYYYDLNLLIHYVIMLSDFNYLRVIYNDFLKCKIKLFGI